MNHIDTRLASLERRVYELEGEVRELRAQLSPPRKGVPSTSIDSSVTAVQCRACGMTLNGVMAYHCPRAYCSAGLGGAKCHGVLSEATV